MPKNPYDLRVAKDGQFHVVGTYSSLAKLKTAWSKNQPLGSLQARVFVDGHYSIINDQMPVVALKEFRSAEERDASIIEDAAYFTAVRFLGVGQYERHELPTREEAVQLASKLSKEVKGNYMIYAVNAAGRSAYVESVIYKK